MSGGNSGAELTRAEFLRRYVGPYQTTRYVHTARGWIVWRRGTGGNCELLHVRAFEPGRGHGRALVRAMLAKLEHDRRQLRDGEEPFPATHVYGFALPGAHGFYAALGFHLTPVRGLYRDGDALLFWREYDRLLETV